MSQVLKSSWQRIQIEPPTRIGKKHSAVVCGERINFGDSTKSNQYQLSGDKERQKRYFSRHYNLLKSKVTENKIKAIKNMEKQRVKYCRATPRTLSTLFLWWTLMQYQHLRDVAGCRQFFFAELEEQPRALLPSILDRASCFRQRLGFASACRCRTRVFVRL